MRSPFWLIAWSLYLGCQIPATAGQEVGAPSAGQLWQLGQAAMRSGEPRRAIGFYERSLQVDPGLTRNYLSLAAAYLDSGADQEACIHLGRYVGYHPEQLLIRSQYAELLIKLKRVAEACAVLTRLAADQQERGDEGLPEVVQCHSKLLDLAEAQEDDYGIHLHRGIGLYWLARQRSSLEDPDGKLPTQALLCRSASELTQARMLRPREAQPWWYLHLTWSRLGQVSQAKRCLTEASAALPFCELTTAELRSLALASRVCSGGGADR
jgi:tetratricopeptide (TPR) repeat protein